MSLVTTEKITTEVVEFVIDENQSRKFTGGITTTVTVEKEKEDLESVAHWTKPLVAGHEHGYNVYGHRTCNLGELIFDNETRKYRGRCVVDAGDTQIFRSTQSDTLVTETTNA